MTSQSYFRNSCVARRETDSRPIRLRLDAIQPLPELSHLRAEFGEFACELAELVVGGRGDSQASSDKRALSLVGDNQLGSAQLLERPLNRLGTYAVFRGQLALSRQLVPGREIASFDLPANPVCDAQIPGTRIAQVDAVHDRECTSKASQDGEAGATWLLVTSKTSKLSMFASSADASAVSARQQETPAGAATPTGAHIETLGVTMQVEATRLYRVRTVADQLDVSVATIYRAVESGALKAIRLGTGKGAVRIPGSAIEEYLDACASAAATRVGRAAEDMWGASAGGAA